MPWLDLIVVAVLVFFVLYGYFKGFWRLFLSLFSSIVVVALSFLLAKPVSMALESWFGLATAISNGISGGIENFLSSTGVDTGFVATLLQTFLGPGFDPSNIHQLALDFSNAAAKLLVFVISMIIMYVILRIAMHFLLKLVNRLSLHISSTIADKILGVLFGILKGFFQIMMVSFALFSLGSVFTGLASWLDGVFVTNGFAKVLYDLSIKIVQDVIIPFVMH